MKNKKTARTYLNAHRALIDVSLYEAFDNAQNVLDDDVRRFNDELKRFTRARKIARQFKQALRVI